MKKCIVISDSFKGTLSSEAICTIARQEISAIFPACQVVALPVADGGEGTVDCFLSACGGEKVACRVCGPLGETIDAFYGLLPDGTAVVEMAAAAGLPLVPEGRRDPSRTTTYGVGQLLHHAVEHGARRVILGLGGSATNDGGCGAAAALGAVFTDKNGYPFVPVGATLSEIESVDASAIKQLLQGVHITAMCDIDNPMYGPQGAAAVFAPQKGADEAMVAVLDGQLRHLAGVMERRLSCHAAQLQGAGAAGAFGAGCVAFLGAELKSGIETVIETVGLPQLLQDADLVITGEGRIDHQSLRGKVICGVAQAAKAQGVPVLVIAGDVDESAYAAYDFGVSAIFSINRRPLPFSQAAPLSAENYRHTLRDILRCIRSAEGFARST